jgi:hypothetical protein
MTSIKSGAKVLAVVPMLALLFIFSAPVQAAVVVVPNNTIIYVSTLGSDSTGNGTNANPFATIQKALTEAATGDIIDVAAGTYTGDITPSVNNLTIKGNGSASTILNLGAGYGVNLDNGLSITGVTFTGFTVNASPTTSYALKAYKADGLTLTDDTFNGSAGNNSSNKDGGVDINTTSNVTFNNVTSSNFYKNGFADTPAYTTADSTNPGNNITFNAVTASNDGWTGISFYSTGNSGGSADIKGVQFTGTSTLSNDGAGIFIEGDTDANFGANNTPINKITTDGTTLNLQNVAFSSNTADDIINYQTVPVDAVGATFEGVDGDAMSSAQHATQDAKILDKLDVPAYGLVSYYMSDTIAPVVTVTPNASVIGGITTFTIKVADNKPLNPALLTHVYVYLYNNGGAQKSQGGSVNLSTGTGIISLDTSKLDDGAATLDVGRLFDASGNASGAGDTYFGGYTVDNTAPVVAVTPIAGSTLNGTTTFNITINDANPATTTNSSIYVYLYNSAAPQASQGAKVNLSSGTNTFTVDTTKIANGGAWLDVGRLEDAVGNFSGKGDTYFKNYVVDNTVTAPATLATPSNLAFVNPNLECGATTPNDNGITATWNSVLGATTYEYSVVAPQHQYPNPWTTTVSTNSYTGTFTDGPGVYTYMVQAKNAAGDLSAWSNSCSVTYNPTSNNGGGTTHVVLTAPILVSPTNNSTTTDPAFSDTWLPVSGAASYKYQTANVLNPDGTLGPVIYSDTSAAGNYTITPSLITRVNNGTPVGNYYWEVAAVDASGNAGPWSVINKVTYDPNYAAPSTNPSVTTDAVANITASDATLSGTNGPVDATGHSIWVSTSPIITSSPVIPAGVYSTPDFGTLSANTMFSAQLPSLTTSAVVNGQVAGTMPAITPNTTYYYVAWSYVNGTWYHGEVLSFVTTSSEVTSAPTVAAQTVNTAVNTPINITLTGSTSGITFSTTTNPASGTLSGTAPDFTYTPDADFTGTDSFTFVGMTSDGITTAPATITINVGTEGTSEGNPPTIANQNVSFAEGSVNNAIMLTTSTPGASPTYATTSSPTHGTLTGTGAILAYTPNAGYHGADSFTYTASDTGGTSAPATISITVNQLATAPVAQNQSVSVTAGATLTITLTASTTSEDPLVFATTSSPTNGTLTGTGANLVYTPNAGYSGSDSFTFTATDDGTMSNTGTITVTVNPVVAPTPEVTSNNFSSGSGGSGAGVSGSRIPQFSIITTSGQPSGPGVSGGRVLGASTYNFAVNFGYGTHDQDVIELQKILIADGYLKIAAPSGWYGSLTRAAVRKYQAANVISPTSGYVGPLTRKILNEGTIPTTTT